MRLILFAFFDVACVWFDKLLHIMLYSHIISPMQKLFNISTNGQGLYEFTNNVEGFIGGANIKTGLLTLFCKHTSCSLLITENADPDVKTDMSEFFSQIVPENMKWIRHICEGADDMPAHIKAALTQTSLSIPITNGRLALGTWQGIYLFEHRKRPHQREVLAHISA